jgi:hypothetical protein
METRSGRIKPLSATTIVAGTISIRIPRLTTVATRANSLSRNQSRDKWSWPRQDGPQFPRLFCLIDIAIHGSLLDVASSFEPSAQPHSHTIRRHYYSNSGSEDRSMEADLKPINF